MAGAVGARAYVGGVQRPPRRGRRGRARGSQRLHPGDAAVPERRAAHRASEELRARRRDRALPAAQRAAGAASDGIRRVRAAGGEPRDPDGRASAPVDRGVDRGVPAGVPLVGDLDRLVARDQLARPVVLPLDAVDLPAVLRARAGVSQGGGGQLVPARPDGAGQRAGDRRPLRALRGGRRTASAGAVVLQDHRLRRPAAGRPGHDPLARARQGDAAQLDRPQRRRPGDVPLRGGARPTTRCSRPVPTRCSAPPSS